MKANSSLNGSADDLARECLYRFLAAVAGGPYAPGWGLARDPESLELALSAAEWLARGPSEEAPNSVQAECSRLVHELRAPLEELRADYDRVFGLVVPKQCPPYETEYYPTQETFARSQQMADIAGFYEAFGVRPAEFCPERPDYLALELEFMALLIFKKRIAQGAAQPDPAAREQASIAEEAQRGFFSDHLAWWVPSFAAALRRKAVKGHHEALGRMLTVWIPDECRRLGIEAVLRPAHPELIELPDQQSGCAACPLLG